LHQKGATALHPDFFRDRCFADSLRNHQWYGQKNPRQDILCFSVFDKQKDSNEQPMALSATKGKFEF
jgi:hypothetical protein